VPDESDPASVLAQKENESAYRQLLIQGTLAVLLPTEDLENDCLTSLVGQILSEMILGNGIGGKACEPWLLWEGITKITEVIRNQMPKAKAQARAAKSTDEVQKKETDHVDEAERKIDRRRWSLQKTFWLVLQYAFLAFTTLRFVVVTIATSSSLPSRVPPLTKISGSKPVKDHLQAPDSVSGSTSPGSRIPKSKQPILTMKIWPCASNLLDLDVRMPWLSATLSMLQWYALRGPGGIGYTDGMIDKLLSHAIHTHVLNPALLPVLLRNVRAALFPNNAPAPPRVVPSPEEQLLIRRRCAEGILALIPGRVQEVYFGDGEERRIREVEEVLNAFDDSYCNKHLIYGVVDLIVVRLMPELAEKGVTELLEERLT